MKQFNSDFNNPIPYKYIDADNKVYKEPILKNDKGEISSDITPNQSMLSKKNVNNKIENIENLSEDEIRNLIDEKVGLIQELGQKTNNLQKKLKHALKQLNDKIQESADILYKKDANSTELKWLQEKFETKKNLLNTEKKINHSYKVQYKILEGKIKNRNQIKASKKNLNVKASHSLNKTNSTKSLSITKSVTVSNSLYMSIEDELNLIKNKNMELISEINKIKEKKISQKKEVDDILSGDLENQLKLKMEEMQQFNKLKMDCNEKYKTLNKSMNMVKDNIKHFEEKAKKLEGKNELVIKEKLDSYNFLMNLIKNEINNNTQEELINLIKENKSEFLKEINKKRNIQKKKKLFKDASTDMIRDNNNNNKSINPNNNNLDEKKLNPNKNIYAIFALLNNIANKNNNKNNNDKINSENIQLGKLIEDENIFSSITENQYRELVNKKEVYIETSFRLEKTIESFKKTENSKYSKIAKAINEKLVQLKLVKEKNKLIQDEVNNLENIYQLSLEKENIKKEINKKLNIKITKNISKKPEEKIIIKDKNYINATIHKNQNIEKNENDLKKTNIKENTKKEDDFPETRDEQLEKKKKKYMDNEENDNDNNNNENNDIENMENIDNTERELNKEDLNEENKQFEEKENKPEQQLPFKV